MLLKRGNQSGCHFETLLKLETGIVTLKDLIKYKIIFLSVYSILYKFELEKKTYFAFNEIINLKMVRLMDKV